MTDQEKHPADVLADKLEQQFPLGTAQGYLNGEAATMLRTIPELEKERDKWQGEWAALSQDEGKAERAIEKLTAERDALRAELAALKDREAQPAALIRTWHKGLDQHVDVVDWCDVSELEDGLHKLYAAPQAAQPQPLTYDQIVDALVDDAGLNLAYRSYEDDMKFARAIERMRAHGIGKK